MRLALVGFGTVGQGLAEAVALKKGLLHERLGADLDIVAAFDSKTYSYDSKGLDPPGTGGQEEVRKRSGQGPEKGHLCHVVRSGL
jgi:homoserine dehydrogenase